MDKKYLGKFTPEMQKKINEASDKALISIMRGENPKSDHREITIVQTPARRQGYVQILIKCYIDDPEFLKRNKFLVL